MKILETFRPKNSKEYYYIAKYDFDEVKAHDSELMFLEQQGFDYCDELTMSDKMSKGKCSCVIVAIADIDGTKRIVGYINDQINKRDDSVDHYILGHSVTIDRLVVDEKFRRKHLATKMMQHMFSESSDGNKYGFLQLLVNNNNTNAIILYEKMGFKLAYKYEYNDYYSTMLKQVNPTLDVCSELLIKSIKELGKAPQAKEINAWFDKVRSSKIVDIEKSLNTARINKFLRDKGNGELFSLVNHIALDYYKQKEIEGEGYNLEEYASSRTNEYYQNQGACSNTINNVDRNNKLFNPKLNHGPEVIQILKGSVVTALNCIQLWNESLDKELSQDTVCHDEKIS